MVPGARAKLLESLYDRNLPKKESFKVGTEPGLMDILNTVYHPGMLQADHLLLSMQAGRSEIFQVVKIIYTEKRLLPAIHTFTIILLWRL